MVRFQASVEFKGKVLPLVVLRDMSRTRIELDGRQLLDQKFFVPKEVVPFKIGLQPATLRFVQSGFREEGVCDIDGREYPLTRLERDGSVETEEQKHVRLLRTAALVAMALSLVALVAGWPHQGRYMPKALGIAPFLFFFGIATFIAPVQLERLALKLQDGPPWAKGVVFAVSCS
jgi:hypothetical protein